MIFFLFRARFNLNSVNNSQHSRVLPDASQLNYAKKKKKKKKKKEWKLPKPGILWKHDNRAVISIDAGCWSSFYVFKRFPPITTLLK